MSWPVMHSTLNHFPIVLVIVGAVALLVALVRPMRGAWLYALGSFVLAGISVYPAWLTGESAARFVRDAWYVAPGAVHRHAETADITLWILLALGLVSLIAWLSIVRASNAISPAGWLRTLVSLLAIASVGAIAVTGYLGGKIVVESPILMNPLPPLAVPIPANGTAPATGQPAIPGTSGAAPGGAVQPNPAQPGATTQPAVTAPPSAAPTATQPATTQPAPPPAATPAKP